MPPDRQTSLSPPQKIVDLAHQVLGTIDLDPWSTKQTAILTQPKAFFDLDEELLVDVLAREWSGAHRLFLAVPSGTRTTRALLNKTLTEYRQGRVREALVWIGSNEALLSTPWIWDHLVLMPWRRLRPQFRDNDLGRYVSVNPGSWSWVAYLAPAINPSLRHGAIARFHVAATPFGRIICDGAYAESDWVQSYEAVHGHPYDG